MLNTTGLPCGRRLANLRPGSTLGLSSLPFPTRRGPTQGAVAEEPQQRGVAGAAHQLHALNSRHVHGGWAGSSGGLLVGAAAALRAALPSTLEPCGLEASDPSWRLWRTQLNRQLSDRTPASPVLAPPLLQVGYILGLGDRHPSNLMLDRYSGGCGGGQGCMGRQPGLLLEAAGWRCASWAACVPCQLPPLPALALTPRRQAAAHRLWRLL